MIIIKQTRQVTKQWVYKTSRRHKLMTTSQRPRLSFLIMECSLGKGEILPHLFVKEEWKWNKRCLPNHPCVQW